MLIKKNSEKFLTTLVKLFIKEGNYSVHINSFTIKFRSARVKSGTLFNEEIEVYEPQGISNENEVTELVVDVYGLYKMPVQVEIKQTYTAFFPQEDVEPISKLKAKIESGQLADGTS